MAGRFKARLPCSLLSEAGVCRIKSILSAGLSPPLTHLLCLSRWYEVTGSRSRDAFFRASAYFRCCEIFSDQRLKKNQIYRMSSRSQLLILDNGPLGSPRNVQCEALNRLHMPAERRALSFFTCPKQFLSDYWLHLLSLHASFSFPTWV